MQITKVEVTPVELKLKHPVRMAQLPEIGHLTAVFVRMETRQGREVINRRRRKGRRRLAPADYRK